MKKTVTINLSGYAYTIDEDAYQNLQEYLESLKQHLLTEEGHEEILADIEARIAELFNERMKFGGLQTMTLKEVGEIISTLGRPEDFEIEPEEQTQKEKEATDEEAPTQMRRLYRNAKEKVIGGVCAGLADYTGTDVTAIRLLFVILLFLGGSSFIIYLVMWLVIPRATEEEINQKGSLLRKRFYRNTDNKLLGGVCSGMSVYFGWDISLIRLVMVLSVLIVGWLYPVSAFMFLSYIAAWIIIPPARSAAQKLEMQGKDPNIENIKRYVQDTAERSSAMIEQGIETIKEKNFFQKVFGFFGEVFTTIFKLVFGVAGGCLGCFGALIIIPIIFGLVVALLSLFLHPITWNFEAWDMFFNGRLNIMHLVKDSTYVSMAIVAGVMVLGLPFLVGLYSLIAYIFKLPHINKTVGWVLFAVWIVGIVVSGIFGYITIKELNSTIPFIPN